MTGNEYQELASRTMYMSLELEEFYALHGMTREIEELFRLYYQGHKLGEEHAQEVVGNLLWFIAEYCTSKDWNLEDVMKMNIEKLKVRYPNGFETERSLNRKEGDI